MKEQRNLDRLFQEKFKDFETPPPPFVWNKIEKRLPTKERKERVIPIFWKVAGIAATLFFVVYVVLNSNNKITTVNINKVVEVERQEKDSKSDEIRKMKSNHNQKNKSVVFDDSTNLQDGKESKLNENVIQNNDIAKGTNNKNHEDINFQKKKIRSKSIVNESFKWEKEKKDLKLIKDDDLLGQKRNKSEIAETISASQKKSLKSEVFTSTTIKSANKKPLSHHHKDSIFVSEIDVAATEETKNPLEELLKEKEQQQKTNPNSEISRWQIASSVAPVYFNSLSGGSTIDAQFAENRKTTEVQMSYGLGVQYAVNRKVSIRTGINRLNLGYNTNGIEFMPTLNSQVLANLDSNNFGQTFVVQNTSGVTAFIENPIQTRDQGLLNQRLGYLEIPLELKYRLIDRRFGITFIGGMSSLVLTDNQINAVSSTFNTNLGEASNVNTFSFSTNFGIGIEYRFLKSFQANFEPMFKYQLNTFSNNTNGFKPYFFGLYSGISYHF